MAETSSPSVSFVRHVVIASSRSRRTKVSAAPRSANGHERQAHRRPDRLYPQRDLRDHAKRPLRSDEQIDEVHVRRGEVSGRQLRDARHPIASAPDSRDAIGQDQVEVSVDRARDARARCRARLRSASTTVSARTQSRVVPCLKVAAPAALVATMPPTNAPVNVGVGG